MTVERWEAVSDAIELHRQGLDFADALHLSTSRTCTQLLSFDDPRFGRRARRVKAAPEVVVPR
jgi:predicted nucleic acid-binding protein